MSNKKRINERMEMLQKRSARIEKARRNMLLKVLLKLGMQSAESTKAFFRFQDAIIHALPNNIDEFRGVFEEGTERIVSADGFIKTQKIGVIKPGTELFIMRAEDLPEIKRNFFDETTLITPKMLEGVTAITQDYQGKSVFYGSRDWLDENKK